MAEITRKYHVEVMDNGYSIRILEETGESPVAWSTVAHYVVGGSRAGTKTETLRKRIVGYAVGELKERLEEAINEADNARPDLGLPAEEPETEPQGD